LESKNSTTPVILTVAFLFTPILYAALAATINQSRGPTEAPEWITIARIISVAYTISCLASALFIERHIREKSAEKIRKKGRDPELAILLCGFGVLLSPALIALILFFFGSPVTDVYAYSLFSLIGIGAWSWRQGELFRVSAEGASIPIVRPYTIVLIVLGVLALVFLAIGILLMARPPESYTTPSRFHILWIPFCAFLAAGCWITAFLRARRSSYAMTTTRAISTILLMWFPLGTAAFVYWIRWVRKKENQRINTES